MVGKVVNLMELPTDLWLLKTSSKVVWLSPRILSGWRYFCPMNSFFNIPFEAPTIEHISLSASSCETRCRSEVLVGIVVRGTLTICEATHSTWVAAGEMFFVAEGMHSILYGVDERSRRFEAVVFHLPLSYLSAILVAFKVVFGVAIPRAEVEVLGAAEGWVPNRDLTLFFDSTRRLLRCHRRGLGRLHSVVKGSELICLLLGCGEATITVRVARYAERERCDLGLLAYSSLRMEKVWRPLKDVGK